MCAAKAIAIPSHVIGLPAEPTSAHVGTICLLVDTIGPPTSEKDRRLESRLVLHRSKTFVQSLEAIYSIELRTWKAVILW